MARYGFIHDKLEIKFLILYIMARVTEPISFGTLTELTLCDEGIDYFEFAEAVHELVGTGHLQQDKEELFRITEKGLKNGDICQSSIPYSVRVKADKQVAVLNGRLRRNAMIRTGSEPRPGGTFTVRLSLDDDLENILTIDMLAASAEYAGKLEENFKKHAEEIYNAVLGVLLSDYSKDEEEE